jgi:hypothetical protein
MLIEILKTILGALRSVFRSRAVLLAENLVLRQCCAVRCPSLLSGGAGGIVHASRTARVSQ